MAIAPFEVDMNIMSKVPVNPPDGGFTTETFRAEFDKAGLLLKEYINTVLIPELNKMVDVDALVKSILDETLTATDKAAPAKLMGDSIIAINASIAKKISKTNLVLTLPGSGWSNNTLTVAAAGAEPNNDVFVTAAPESYSAYAEAMVRCIAQGNGTLTFSCDEIPQGDVSVNVIIFT